MTSFDSWKNSKMDGLLDELNATQKKKVVEEKKVDPRFWRPTFAPDGTASAIIRFLPNPPTDTSKLPYIMTKKYHFQGPTGRWYSEFSRTTIGLKDPVADYNKKLWHSGDPTLVEETKGRTQKVRYISNILVLKDPLNKDAEGKVFLWRYLPQIFNKIKSLAQPPPELGEEPIVAFDLLEGANMKVMGNIINTTKNGKQITYPNFDRSQFMQQSALFDGDDAKLQGIFTQLHRLDQFVDSTLFKSYEELETKMNTVLGLNTTTPTLTQTVDQVSVQVTPNQSRSKTTLPITSEEAGMTLDEDSEKYLEDLEKMIDS